MMVITECALCGRESELLSDDGLCRNPTNPDDPRPRINACEDLVDHISNSLRARGVARLRTKQRTPAEAKRILVYSARLRNLGVEIEEGDTWVRAELTDSPMPRETQELAEPPAVVQGFKLDDLDISKLHLDLIEAKRKAALYTQMAQIEDGWQNAARDAWAEQKQLQDLIDAWEELHGYNQAK